jgi:dihydroflavonol-4-reductase
VRPGGEYRKVLTIWKHYDKQPESLLEQVEWLPADLTDKAEMTELLEGADELYHCAAKVSFQARDKKEMYRVNTEAVKNIVNCCLGQGNIRLLHVSSIAAIGGPDREVFDETSGWPARSRSVYARTKTLGEFEVWRGITEGLQAVIVNPSVILGPGPWQQSSARFFDVVYKGLNYYTLGETGFVDVQDVVSAMILLMRSEITGERFILNAANMSYKALFEKIAAALQVVPPQKYAGPFKTALAWRMEFLKQLLTGIEPRVTRQSAYTAHKRQGYSSSKIQRVTGKKFLPMDETIQRVAHCYLSDTVKSQN